MWLLLNTENLTVSKRSPLKHLLKHKFKSFVLWVYKLVVDGRLWLQSAQFLIRKPFHQMQEYIIMTEDSTVWT